jgi:hypothetical protein
MCRREVVPQGTLTFDTCATVASTPFEWQSWMTGLIILGVVLLCCCGCCFFVYWTKYKKRPISELVAMVKVPGKTVGKK